MSHSDSDSDHEIAQPKSTHNLIKLPLSFQNQLSKCMKLKKKIFTFLHVGC